jgi:hypothetical protein
MLWETPPEQFSEVLAQCKAEGVTFGSLLIAALHFAVAKMSHAEGRFCTPWRFTHDIDVNLRGRCPLPLGNKHVGLLIGMMQVAPQSIPLNTSGTIKRLHSTEMQCLQTARPASQRRAPPVEARSPRRTAAHAKETMVLMCMPMTLKPT